MTTRLWCGSHTVVMAPPEWVLRHPRFKSGHMKYVNLDVDDRLDELLVQNQLSRTEHKRPTMDADAVDAVDELTDGKPWSAVTAVQLRNRVGVRLSTRGAVAFYTTAPTTMSWTCAATHELVRVAIDGAGAVPRNAPSAVLFRSAHAAGVVAVYE